MTKKFKNEVVIKFNEDHTEGVDVDFDLHCELRICMAAVMLAFEKLVCDIAFGGKKEFTQEDKKAQVEMLGIGIKYLEEYQEEILKEE